MLFFDQFKKGGSVLNLGYLAILSKVGFFDEKYYLKKT